MAGEPTPRITLSGAHLDLQNAQLPAALDGVRVRGPLA